MAMPDSLIGKQIDQFRIERYIARGAMGMVFQAFDSILARRVALKIIPKATDEGWSEAEKISREEARKRLIQEAKAAGRLSHPNIVTIHSYGETDELQYICMEYVEGRTLTQILEERQTLPESEVIPILIQVLSALEAAGREHIIHRDIKPSNIMLTHDHRVKVMDFGIAKLPSLSMTVTGMVLGTPFYMSPEQISGQKVDIRSDLFSTGAVLYELLTGQKPFPGDTTATLTFKILQVDPAPPTDVNPDISDPMSEITLKALAKNPDERYQSPSEMMNALRRLQERPAVQAADRTVLVAETIPDARPPAVPAEQPRMEPPSKPSSGQPGPTPRTPPPRGPGEPTRREADAPGEEGMRPDPVRHPVEPEEPPPRTGHAERPARASRDREDVPRAPAASRALGVLALLLLLLAGGFILYVTLQPPQRTAQAPISAPDPTPIPQPAPAPAAPEAPAPPPAPPAPDRDTMGRSLDALLLEAGKNFVNNPGTARRLLNEALAVDPNHYESLLMLARLSSFQKDYPGAIRHYEAALRANSQAGEAYFELGSLQVAQADYAAAVRNLEACLALMPRNRDDVLTSLGFAYSKLNNPRQANRLFEEALAFNPNNERARALLTGLLPQAGLPTPLEPSKASPPKIEGKYSVEGTNPNGSKYHGVATIARRDNRYTMTWTIGGQAFSGSGSLSGGTLTIAWKGPTGDGGVVTYTQTPTGVLKGVWGNGKGSETLTPLK